LIDTSIAVDSRRIASVGASIRVAISALTLAELTVGPHAVDDDLKRACRREHLRRVETMVETLPFDIRCAQAWSRVYVSVDRVGRKPRGSRAVDLMIAATALAHGLPLYTKNAKDLCGLENLIEIVDVGRSSDT
jgi:predicted nucleic acid-binding protein